MARKRSPEDRLASVLDDDDARPRAAGRGSSRKGRAKKSNGSAGPARSARRRRSGGSRKKEPATRNMLITGVSRYWGERLALHMERDQTFDRVHGIDIDRPRVAFRRTHFTHLDIRSPMIVDFLHSREIDTVVHLQVLEGADAETLFQRNVMDYMFLLSACADAGVEHFVLMSETAVYGHRPDNPAAIREDRYLVKKENRFLDRSMGMVPHLQNLLEVEKYTFRFRHDQARAGGGMRVVPLRFAPILGPRCNTWMTRYLREPMIVTALGFDPLVQLIHEDDVVRALYQASTSDIDGPVNVAAPGVLTLHQLIRKMGKTWVPFLHSAGNLWRKFRKSLSGEEIAPLGMNSLKFSCIGDLTRMREEFAFEPRMSAHVALEHFAEHRRMARYYHEQPPEELYGKYVEEALRGVLAEDSLGMEES